MKILIAGYGNIGKHVEKELKELKKDATIYIYDKYKKEFNDNSLITNEIFDFCFICVPTEMNPDGSADISEVEWCIDSIRSDVFIIKSAIPVTTTENLCKTNVVVSPEYYGTTQHSLESPNFCILGGDKEYTHKVAQLYSKVKNGSFRFIFTNTRTAELAKYMENCWLATKVTFCNEFADIAEAFGISYDDLRECFIADERVNPSHTYVYDDKRYYDSHCLNKDIPSLIVQSPVDTPLMQTVLNIKLDKKMKANKNK